MKSPFEKLTSLTESDTRQSEGKGLFLTPPAEFALNGHFVLLHFIRDGLHSMAYINTHAKQSSIPTDLQNISEST